MSSRGPGRPVDRRPVDDGPVDRRPVERSADGWVECGCGSRHWGRRGAAGLLLHREGSIVLQHRAAWSHHGGTWGMPGGAVDHDESAVAGALREAQEEAGVEPGDVEVRATWLLDHGDWSYTTVVAEARRHFLPQVCDAESDEVRWVPLTELGGHPLLPAFAAALPDLTPLIGRRLVLVVDAANTVGSRPDGWWRDRRGATARLRDELDTLASAGLPAAALGLPGHRWFPDVVLVTEGAARGVTGAGRVSVAEAPADGDAEILRRAIQAAASQAAASRVAEPQAAESADAPAPDRPAGGGPSSLAEVLAVTSDRALRQRLSDAGVRSIGPGALGLNHRA